MTSQVLPCLNDICGRQSFGWVIIQAQILLLAELFNTTDDIYCVSGTKWALQNGISQCHEPLMLQNRMWWHYVSMFAFTMHSFLNTRLCANAVNSCVLVCANHIIIIHLVLCQDIQILHKERLNSATCLKCGNKKIFKYFILGFFHNFFSLTNLHIFCVVLLVKRKGWRVVRSTEILALRILFCYPSVFWDFSRRFIHTLTYLTLTIKDIAKYCQACSNQ